MSRETAYKEYGVWRYNELRCRAYTKSEARATFKMMLGVDRLPLGAFIARIDTKTGPIR